MYVIVCEMKGRKKNKSSSVGCHCMDTKKRSLVEAHLKDMEKCGLIEQSMALSYEQAIFLLDNMGRKLTGVDRWWGIPSKCRYRGKTWRVLEIDMQGGYFILQDPKRGVLPNVDMDKCDPV